MFTAAKIAQMRWEIENPELMKERIEREEQADAIVSYCKWMFTEEGRDFDAEFAAWQKQQ
jgi:hypothetical protein